MQRILLEGNIGAGKSTLGKSIHGRNVEGYKIEYLKEPVAQWTSTPRGNLLAKCSADPAARASMFQVLTMQTMAKSRREAFEKATREQTLFLEERSIYSSRNVFTQINFMQEEISEDSLYILDKLFNDYTKNDDILGIIYLDCNIDTAMERIKERGHSADTLLTRDYVKQVDDVYKMWLGRVSWPVFTVDASVTSSAVMSSVLEALEHLLNHEQNNNN